MQSRKLRQHLDGLLSTTREMPSRMRQYAAFEYVQDMLRQHLKSNVLVSELKSEALRERHWRQLFKVLRVSNQYSPSSMTLGSVWDLDLRKNEAAIKEVIMQAQGEMALEEFLKQVRRSPLNIAHPSADCCATGQGMLDELLSRSRQLPKQDSTDSRMGRPLHEMQRESQLALCDEAFAVLQGLRGGVVVLGGSTESHSCFVRRLDRCSATMGLSRVSPPPLSRLPGLLVPARPYSD